MEYKMLGGTELRVSVLGLGCSHIGRSVFSDNRQGAREILETAFDGGINFFDTAPTYRYGGSERSLGRVLKGRRDRVVLATKGGYRYSSYASYARHFLPIIAPLRPLLVRQRARLKQRSKKRQDFSARYLRATLESSLRRLRTDYVDLYLLHSPPIPVIQSEEVLRFLEDSIQAGKVRYCGASVGTMEEARGCLEYSVFSCLQVSFSLIEQAATEALFTHLRSKRFGLIARTPLARGILTRKHRVATGPEPETADRELHTRRHQALQFLLSEHHPTLEIAALRFVLDQPEIASVLTGTSNPAHLRENLRAVAAPSLSPEIMAGARRLPDMDLV